MKTKLVLYLILLLGLNSYSQINVSTGIDGSGNALSIGTVDPFWQIASSPNPPATPAVVTSSFSSSVWEPTPVSITNAEMINASASCCGNLSGIYTFERDFSIPTGTTNFIYNFSVAYDDAIVSLELVQPDLTTIPLTVVPTTSYHLSLPITNTLTSPMAGTWKIRATINFIDSIAFYLLSGYVSLNCQTLYVDSDNDGYDNGTVIDCSGSIPTGYSLTTLGTDCDDTNSLVNPVATEICYDGIDNNCDGTIDEGCPNITQVVSSQCGSTLSTIDEFIYANAVSGFVSGSDIYRFEVIKMIAGVPDVLSTQFRDNTWFPKLKLTSLPQFDFDTSYQIRVAVRIAGVWYPFGTSCIVTTPIVYTQVKTSQCGSLIPTMGTTIEANLVPFAPPFLPYLGNYLFEVTNSTTMVTETIARNMRDFNMSLTAFTPGFATHSTTYNVRIAVRKYDGTYMPFGPMCTITTPSIPTTQVRASQCNTVIASTSTFVYADSVTGATNYKFRLSCPSPVYSQEFVGIGTGALSRKFKLNNFTPAPLLPAGTLYDIEVCVSMDGGITYGAYGTICKISTPGAFRPEAIERETSTTDEFNAVVYPNPTIDSFLFEITSERTEPIELKVYDMIGRQIETRTISFDAVSSTYIGTNYPTGVYNIIITQGEHLKMVKVIKR